MNRPAATLALGTALLLPSLTLAQSAPPPPPPTRQNPPVPRPFPGVNPPATTTAPAPDAAVVVGQEPAPGELMVGNAPVYPAAERLDEFDAGQGQRFVIFGTNLPYEDIVTYYKARLRDNGREIFSGPAMQQFELGRFDDNTMAYPPSIVVKDYSWEGSPGYLHIDGTTEMRYRTIIQIVPAPGVR